MRKPVFNLFWLLLCVCSIWGCGVRPGEKTPQNQTQEMLSYEIVDAEVTITHCNEAADGDLEIPAEIAGLPVTSIGEAAFRSSLLTSITIPDSVTSIGTGACAGCVSLNSVTIPGSVTSIGEGSFMVCPRLTSINIPDGVTSIGDYAFRECTSLSSITIGDSVTSIGKLAFFSCWNLTSVTIPETFHSEAEASRLGLDKLWPDGFSLPASTVLRSNGRTGMFGALNYEIADGLVTITDCDGAVEGDLEIPAEIAGLPATSIGKGAFVNCSRLTSVTIPDGVISIEDWAFHRCSSLASVTIPDSVTTIGDFAFANCFGLKSVTIPQAFHSKDEASRLKLDKLWPNDFSLPAGTSK